MRTRQKLIVTPGEHQDENNTTEIPEQEKKTPVGAQMTKQQTSSLLEKSNYLLRSIINTKAITATKINNAAPAPAAAPMTVALLPSSFGLVVPNTCSKCKEVNHLSRNFQFSSKLCQLLYCSINLTNLT